MRKFAQLGVTIVIALIMSGCGDVYRPVVIPNPPPTPDPKPAHNAFVISNNGLSKGTGMQVNVSGDTNMGVIPLGIEPQHASLNGTGTRVLTANSLSDTASIFVPASTFSIIAKIADVVLPTGFNPSFVTTTETTSFYVGGSGRNSFPPSIAFVNGSNVAGADIQALPGTVGTTISMAETPDTRKLYAASSNGNSVTPINIIDHTFNASIPVATPVWVTARSDSGRVYVLSQANGSLLEINPVDDSTVPNTVTAGAGANYMSYDSRLNRLYVTNPVSSTATVVSVAGAAAQTLKTIAISPVTRDSAADVCASPTPGAVKVVSATSLPNGTRAYVGGYTTLDTGISISSASGDGTFVTYTYNLASGPPLAVGMSITVTGFSPSSYNGEYRIASISTNTFQVFSTATGSSIGTGTGVSGSICPQVTVINPTDNSVTDVIAIPRAPLVLECDVRFRLSMAASADSSKVYVGSCDAGSVAIIHTDSDQVAVQLLAPPSVVPSSGGGAPPPQNPVFVLAGQ